MSSSIQKPKNNLWLYGSLVFSLLFSAISIYVKEATAVPANYYFSSSTGSNANMPVCSQVSPCHHLYGTALAANGAIPAGSTVNLKRGDSWEGQEAEFQIASSGTSGNEVFIQAYGTGENPILFGASVTTGWTSQGGGIYSKTGQSQTYLKTVAYKLGGIHKGLLAWGGATNALPEGSYIRSGSTLYIRLPGGANPETSEVRIGNFSHTAADGSADGSQGLLRGAENATYASYQKFRDIQIIGANGVGFSYDGTGQRTANLNVVASGQDGMLCWHRTTLGACSDYTDYYSEISYGVNAPVGGQGQAFTAWGGPYGWLIGTYIHDNAMAGLDFLDFASDTNVTESGALRVTVINNGLAQMNPSYDGNIYIDGASEIFIYGAIFGKNGTSRTGTAANARSGLQISSEHPTTKPSENIWIVNSYGSGIHWVAVSTGEICYNSPTECPPSGDATPPNKNKNINLSYLTLTDYDAGSYDMDFIFSNLTNIAGTLKLKNSIIVYDSSYANAYMNSTNKIESDYNNFYKRGQASTSTAIYHTCDGCGGTAYSRSAWASLTGNEAHSVYGDPLMVNNGDTAGDPTLQDGSPARDAGTTSTPAFPAWLPATIATDIGSRGIRGTTKADGSFDDVAVAPDMGYHKDYAGLVNITVSPTSSTANAVTSYTVTFRMPELVTALLYNWKVKFTFPAGYTLSSGSASSVTSANISGTWTTAVSGQSITGTRVGDGNSEFPGLYSIVISNVKNPGAGTTGTFLLETQKADGTKIAEYYDHTNVTNAIPGIVISSGSPIVCGNSLVESGEDCDNGESNGVCDAACSATCMNNSCPVCGDTVLDAGEACDDGGSNGVCPAVCSASCNLNNCPVCGNSIVESGEQCDDGGTTDLDGCSATCQTENPVCGNGATEYLETCDDSNTSAGDGCSDTCQTEVSPLNLTARKGLVMRGVRIR